MSNVSARDFPVESQLHAWLEAVDFHDAYECRLNDRDLTPTEIFIRAARATPGWAEMLMTIRNRAVSLLGLKDVGNLGNRVGRPAESYAIGDRLGIFTVFAKTETELVLGIDDLHLDVRVSILKISRDSQPFYVMSTVVKTHNRLGRLYMLPVGRIHPVIVKSLMRRAVV